MPQINKENLNIVYTDPIFTELSDIAEELGVKIYVIGGFVRDLLLSRAGKNIIDTDFSVIGDALTFAQSVAKRFNSKAILYERFGTALVPLSGGRQLEFVGTRKEEYQLNSRNPIVTIGTLDDDIKRRDFTINTLAISINKEDFGQLIEDKFFGIKDLEEGRITTPLDPEVTFNDDPLRMLRCIRFATQLDFQIDTELLKAIRRLKSRIKIIAQERISDELLKIMKSKKPSIGFYHLFDTGLLEYIFPEVYKLAGVDIVSKDNTTYAHKDVFKHTLQVLDNISPEAENNVWLRFAALLHDIAKPMTKQYKEGEGWTFWGHEEKGARLVKKIFKNLKLPLNHVEYVEKLVRLHQRPMQLVDEKVTESALRRLAADAGDSLVDLLTLCKADITTRNEKKVKKYLNNYKVVWERIVEVQEKDKLRAFQSPVRGEEIMEICHIGPSRLVGIIKTNIEEAILEGAIPNEYDAAKEYFLAHKDRWINLNLNS